MHRNTILLSSSRSGTNFFLDVCGRSYPSVLVLSEIFRGKGDSFAALHRLTGLEQPGVLAMLEADPCGLWQRICAAAAAQNRSAMAKIFYYHQPADHPLWEHIRQHDRVVHLIRSNLFDVWVSRTLMLRTGEARLPAHKSRDGRETRTGNLTFTADPAEAEQFIAARQDYIRRFRAFFAGADITELLYEDISATPADCLAAISDIFGPPETPQNAQKTGLRRQKQRQNHEIVENYADVAHLDHRYF